MELQRQTVNGIKEKYIITIIILKILNPDLEFPQHFGKYLFSFFFKNLFFLLGITCLEH